MRSADIAARLRAWTDSFGQHWVCAAYDHGPMCRRCTATTREVVDAVRATHANNARLTRQLAFDSAHARLTAAAVAIEDAGVLPEGCKTTVSKDFISFDFGQRFSCTVHPAYGGVRWAWSGHPDHGIRRSGYDAPDPVEAAVAAIAATTEGAT